MDNSRNLPSVDMQSALIKIVERQDIDPDRLEKFLDLQIKMEERQAKVAFSEALSSFQGDCPIIQRIKKVDFTSKSGNSTKYNYAPLDEIVHIIKPILQKWGLSFTFNVKNIGDNQHEIITKIRHKAGHQEETSYYFNPLHDDTRMNMSQRAKSAITFAKRAALENALGITTAGEDDDARRAIDTVISSVELDTIKSLMKNTKTEEKNFLAFMKVDSLEELSGAEAKKAIHALKQKRIK